MPRAASLRGVARPDVEVLAAVAGRGVDEAGAGVVGDMVAGEQRHVEVVAAADALQRMRADDRRQIVSRHVAQLLDTP